MLSIVLKIGPGSLLALMGMIGTFLFGLMCMAFFYCLILFLSGVNPLTFLKKYAPYMVQFFSLAASNAAIPLNMEFCNKKAHISPRIYSFSIPLGATINMDGMCILLAVQSLTLAKTYGVAIPFNMLLPLAVSIVLLSIGAPGVPGSGVIMMSMLVTQLGVPVESVALVIGIGPLVGMFINVTNCLGDVVATTIVAKSEKMIDTNYA